MRRDYPLAALDVISQRCRELMSAKDHHGPTTRAADTMTAPEQLGAARMEATESRDEDDHSHVVQVNKTIIKLSIKTSDDAYFVFLLQIS